MANLVSVDHLDLMDHLDSVVNLVHLDLPDPLEMLV